MVLWVYGLYATDSSQRQLGDDCTMNPSKDFFVLNPPYKAPQLRYSDGCELLRQKHGVIDPAITGFHIVGFQQRVTGQIRPS